VGIPEGEIVKDGICVDDIETMLGINFGAIETGLICIEIKTSLGLL
jgi:hypothetical protein